MEYEKQIEIKLEGNNCIINFPKEQNISRQNSSLTNLDDISFSVSLTSDEGNISKNNLNNRGKENPNNKSNSNSKQYLYSNEKSKLEITYLSIFNSELKTDSSNLKTPLFLLNSKNNDKIQQQKDSVVKKLNFDKIQNDKDKNELKENKYNSEIPNINIRKLPLIKKNNVIKKISKNLNKEYFIHEKIFSSNNKNKQRMILDKKLKENSIKNSGSNYFYNKNKTQILDNTNNFINFNNESFNTNKYQITENFTTKGNLNFLSNKNNKNNNPTNNTLILNKCPSKPNLPNMRLKLNNIIKVNTKEKEKENNSTYKDKLKNGALKELDIMPKIINNKKLIKNQILYPSLTSGNNNTNLNTFNSFNKSANNNNKINSFNINDNSNIKTPLIVNKQILLKTPKTNSYSCSTSYSAKNNKIQNDINTSSDVKNSFKEKDPILIKIEAHNSLLKNFFMNNNNFKNKENKENISSNINNDEYKFFINNNFNNNTNEKNYGKKIFEDSININSNNKEIRLKKFNTDFKIPKNKNKKMGLLTERNMKNNNMNISCLNEAKYPNINDWQKLFKNEYGHDLLTSIKK